MAERVIDVGTIGNQEMIISKLNEVLAQTKNNNKKLYRYVVTLNTGTPGQEVKVLDIDGEGAFINLYSDDNGIVRIVLDGEEITTDIPGNLNVINSNTSNNGGKVLSSALSSAMYTGYVNFKSSLKVYITPTSYISSKPYYLTYGLYE